MVRSVKSPLTEEGRLARAELGDDDWEWNRHKSLLKEAISEWVRENPSEGKQMVTNALATYIDELVREQLRNLGKLTVKGVLTIFAAALLYAWWKTAGFKI